MQQTSELSYEVLIGTTALTEIEVYHEALKNNTQTRGEYLEYILQNKNIESLTTTEFIEAILQTRQPKVFAEQDSISRWNEIESKILANISIKIPVKAYHTGKFHIVKDYNVDQELHNPPVDICGITVNGILLKHGSFDYNEVVEEGINGSFKDDEQGYSEAVQIFQGYQPVLNSQGSPIYGRINLKKYEELLARRLLPALMAAESDGQNIVTLPSLGCSAFAGSFENIIRPIYEQCVQNILDKNHEKFKNIKLIQREGARGPEGSDEEPAISKSFGELQYRKVFSYIGGMKTPVGYAVSADEEKNFQNYKVCKIVAGDAFSWPGNGAYLNLHSGSDEEMFGVRTDCIVVFLRSIASQCTEAVKKEIEDLIATATSLGVDFQYKFGLPDGKNYQYYNIIGKHKLKILANDHNIKIYDTENNIKYTSNEYQCIRQFVDKFPLETQLEIEKYIQQDKTLLGKILRLTQQFNDVYQSQTTTYQNKSEELMSSCNKKIKKIKEIYTTTNNLFMRFFYYLGHYLGFGNRYTKQCDDIRICKETLNLNIDNIKDDLDQSIKNSEQLYNQQISQIRNQLVQKIDDNKVIAKEIQNETKFQDKLSSEIVVTSKSIQ